MTRGWIALVFVAALALVPSAAARPQTTAPTLFIDVRVTLRDDSTSLSRYSAPRGAVVRFTITNVGTRPHSFTLKGFTSGFHLPAAFQQVLRPKQKHRILLFLDYRGVLRYYSKAVGDGAIPRTHGTFGIGRPPKSKVDA